MRFFNVRTTPLFVFIFCTTIGFAQNATSNSDNSTIKIWNNSSGASQNNPKSALIHPDRKYKLQQIDNSLGLSNSSINAIFQDSDNLLWIGTWDGLNRYDGSKFKIFRPELNNENSLSNQV
ncbi:MAG: hypothetical protein HUJ11_02370, partial [Arenibacter algicola]|nr:hypothetical protein [Arenibacter algicola]